jgi:hypothetical protein
MNLSSSRAPVPRTAREREERRIRILAMLRSGFSYEAIARECTLTRERIRQIVVASAQTEVSATKADRMRARLEPALRLAARAVENGKLSAIGPLLKVLDRLDRLDQYGAAAEAPAPREGARERLLAKLDRVAARLGTGAEKGASRRLAPAPADAEGKFSSSQTLEKSRNGVGIATPARASAPALQIARAAAKTSSA